MSPVHEMGKSLLGSSITEMVTNSNPENLSIWALVIILFVFITAIVAIIKVFLNSSTKMNEGLKVIIQQNAEQLHIFRESLDRMSENFRLLSEGIAKLQVMRTAEEDKFDVLMQRFQDLKVEISGSHTNLFTAFREHESNNHKFYSLIQQNMEKFRASMLEMRAFCRTSSDKKSRLGDILTESGICTRDQISQALKKQVAHEMEYENT